jgi:hypothetical protein
LSRGRPTTIADAGPTAAPTTAGLSGDAQRAYVVAKQAADDATEALYAAGKVVDSHVGARSGAAYEAKLAAYRQALAEWILAMAAKAARETA